jgi:hypothetical protein
VAAGEPDLVEERPDAPLRAIADDAAGPCHFGAGPQRGEVITRLVV